MRKTWLAVLALGLALTGRASAAPSFFGPTGLLVIPTADTVAQQGWNVHLHAFRNLVTYGGNFGLTKALEIGVTGASPRHGTTEALLNAKYTLLAESGKAPGIAIGGVDIANQLKLDPGVYVVASKSLSALLGGQASKYNLRGHLGYGANSLFNDDIFGGLDVQITPQIQAMVEWIAGDVNFGGRIGFGNGIRAELGSYDGEFGGGVSYAAALR
jgi:Exopolysaccharide biosynthesis protein YbjH